MTNIEILKQIIGENLEINEITFAKFDGYQTFENRIELAGDLLDVYRHALDKKNEFEMPFWDSLNLSLFDRHISESKIFNQICFHNSPSVIRHVPKDKFDLFFTLLKETNEYWTINSKVSLRQSGWKHLFLLDFHIPVSSKNEKICIEVIKALKVKGYLVDSGKSYHFYAKDLLSEEEMLSKLAQSLLFAPIVDRAWIAHQIIERACCLRVSKKYDRLPLKVCFIE
ncbi:hypothetical protein KJK34_12920 [Flavobacterium sp. D11R37]|uniref:primase 1D-like protein n=1 Tax=Flavobacterium coralii TaxID=2838017 RepID=UPI001CA6BFEC|nr:hypothetical protein [Flavobacterium coralii]MBY8963659.1 hypothetical protein [Flavobacterium coralii]